MTQVKHRIADLYGVLETQEPERLNDLLTPDVQAFGLGPKDAYTDRESAMDLVRTELIPYGLRGDQFKIDLTAPKIGMALGEESAWFYDFPRFLQVRLEKSPKRWAVRVTGHLVKQDVWRFDALHVSFGFPDAQLYAENAVRKLKPPATVAADPGLDSDPFVALTKQMLENIAVKIDRTSDADSAVFIGTDASDVFEGGAHFKALARPKLPELKKAQFTTKLEDGPRARLAHDRKSGWVAANVVLRIGAGKKQVTVPTFRALWLFAEEKIGEKDVWSLVSEHQSLGLQPDQRTQAGDDSGDSADAGR